MSRLAGSVRKWIGTTACAAGFLASVGIAGCGSEGDQSGAGGAPPIYESEIKSIRHNLDPNWVTAEKTWNQGQAATYLAPVSDYVCILTRAGGDFDGGGEYVRIFQSGGYWYLGGSSQQSGVHGTARCFNKWAFLANGSARWPTDNDNMWVTITHSSSGAHQGNTWWGDATTMLNGIGGKLRDSGDRAFIIQSNGPFTPSVLRAEVTDGHVRAYAHSFFAGTPSSGVLAKFWTSGEYVADSSFHCTAPGSTSGYGDYEVAMAPVNDAMCHFTYIGGGGNWDGGAEYVHIYAKTTNGVPRWYLRAHSGYCGNNRKTVARARCYRRDQR